MIEVFTIGEDGALTLAQTVPGSTFAIAMAPDGSLFSQKLNGEIDSYPVRADGTLGAERTHFPFTQPANALAIAPDGKTLYMAGQNDLSFQWAIAADASLSFLTPGLFGAPGGPCYPLFIGLAVGTSNVDIQCYFGNGFTFSAGGDGALSVSGGPFTGSGATFGNVEDARGRAFYGGVWAGGIAQFKRRPDGTLAPFPTASVPGPGPDARARRRPGRHGADGRDHRERLPELRDRRRRLALGSARREHADRDEPALVPRVHAAAGSRGSFRHDPGRRAGRRLRRGREPGLRGTHDRAYDWSFGDGTALADAGPAPSHGYPQPGEYTAT